VIDANPCGSGLAREEAGWNDESLCLIDISRYYRFLHILA
jgi:hypothetical protein